MRRSDREVTSPEKIRDIIDRCTCCRVGFNDNGSVYIVPLNFGFTEEQGAYTLYFHGANAGRKKELAESGPEVGFEMDTNYQLNEGEKACNYSARFQSVIGNGKIEIIRGAEERQQALREIMRHVTGKADWTFDPKMLDAVAVFKLTVSTMSCKEHL
jgi:nitroimidazol reductase NimA-like FMN-containing flavoprotein (pyridoxamine 5'-phosphate oxidase superfamily)